MSRDKKPPRVRMLKPGLARGPQRGLAVLSKIADEFYSSSPWRNLMAEIISERGRVCEDPNCPMRNADGSHPPCKMVYGDHIEELQDGGEPLEKSNVMLRCASAHTTKTNQVKRERLGLV